MLISFYATLVQKRVAQPFSENQIQKTSLFYLFYNFGILF